MPQRREIGRRERKTGREIYGLVYKSEDDGGGTTEIVVGGKGRKKGNKAMFAFI